MMLASRCCSARGWWSRAKLNERAGGRRSDSGTLTAPAGSVQEGRARGAEQARGGGIGGGGGGARAGHPPPPRGPGGGSLRLASTRARYEELPRQAGWAKTFALPLELISAEEAERLFPLMSTDGVKGAVWLPNGGWRGPPRPA